MAGKPAGTGVAGKKSDSDTTTDQKAPACCEPDRTPSFNETTVQALEDARSDRNLTRYADEDELFEKLEIKVDKAKTQA